MAKHAVLSASGSSRWIACPPSARLEEKESETTSVYAQEGTLAHKIAELTVRYNNHEFKKATYTRRLNKLKKNEFFSNEMEEYCVSYSGIVWEKFNEAKKRTPDAQLLLEQKLDFSNVVPDGFGTGDAIIIADDTVEVIDFKYGKGVMVSADNNSQMKLYGLGALRAFEMLYDIQNVSMTIVQPRLENISNFTIKTDTLYAWGELIKKKAELAFKGEGEFKAGPHCMFCKVKAKCKAYADEQMELAKHEFKDGPYLDETEIADILLRAADFKKWLTAVEEYALDQAVNHGQEYPGMKVVEGRSNRKYTDDDGVIKTLVAEGYEEPLLYKPKEVLGITAMTKLLGKKQFNNLLSDLIIKPQGKPTLVPESDKRPEWHSEEEAKNDFKNN